MWGIAAFADLVSLIPFVGGFIGDAIALVGFSLIGADVKKDSLFSGDQIALTCVTMVLEIPFGMLPMWCIRVALYKAGH
jgi:hypothetical protein